MKLSQYTKLSPIAALTAQVIGTIVGALLQLVIMKQVISNQREILLDTQGSNVWSGQQVQSFNSQAVSWGALAKYFYGPGSTYQIIPYWCVCLHHFPLDSPPLVPRCRSSSGLTYPPLSLLCSILIGLAVP